MNWLKNILKVCRKELGYIFADHGILVFFFAVPLLYPLLYTYLYNNEVVREVPVVVVDECRSSDSREFLRKSDATADIHIVSYCNDMEAARELIRSHRAYGLIHIPANFSKDIVEGRQTTVNLYSDMSGLLYYKALLSGCTEVSLDMNKNIKSVKLSGLSDREKEVMSQPIEYEYTPMFNPQNGFDTFIIPAVLILVIQQTLVLGISMLAGTERERRQKGALQLGNEYGSPMDVLIGKGAAYFLIYAAVSTYVLCIVPRFFDIPQLWNPQNLILFSVPLLLSCIFFAITISFFVRDRESCFLLFVFASVPLIFISGISWPSSNIPVFWKYFSYIFPSTFGINGFVKLNNTGANLDDIIVEYIALWIQSAVYFMLSLLIYIRLYRSDKMPGKAFVRVVKNKMIKRIGSIKGFSR
jgi:ABC-2 type transport system permease protein